MDMNILNMREEIVKERDTDIQTDIRGAFNKFPEFFVKAFKIVVDS